MQYGFLMDHRRCLELALETRSIAAERGLRSLTESTSRLLGKLKKKLGPEAYAKLEDAVRSGSAS